MTTQNQAKSAGGLYVLGSLYPQVTGGMEIFNYYFLNHQLRDSGDRIYYLGDQPTDGPGGHFIFLKKRWPARFFYPFQFFLTVLKHRKDLDYAYISYAEQSWIFCYVYAFTLRLFKIPYAITIHWGKEPDRKFSAPVEYYFRSAQAVIGVSELICAAFRKTIPGRHFQYIPPLIPFVRAAGSRETAKTALGYTGQEKILLFVGSLKGMKNPDKIIEAIRLIGPEFLDAHQIRILLAGKGELENEIRARVERYQLGKYIRLAGLVNREMIPDYYRAADAYIISSDYEGTSVSLLEAMFNQIAIIASDAPGIHGMVMHEQNGLLYETKRTDQLAESIKRIFSDPVLAERLAGQAYNDFQSRYSYESMMEKYRAVFSSMSKKP